MVRLPGSTFSVALVAALLTVTGCQPQTGTNYGAVQPPAITPTQPNPGTPGAAPVTPVGEPTVITGQAKLAGAPMAQATLRVEDALTGAPLTVRLADGRDVAGDSAGLTTDAQGSFSLPVVGLNADSVVRVIATSEGKSLSAIITGGGLNLSRYQTLATITVNVDEVSRMLDLVATGPLQMIAKTLKAGASAEVRQNLLTELKKTTAKLVEAAEKNPALAAQLNSFSTLTPAQQAAAVQTAFTAANVATEVNTLVSTTLTSTALKAKDVANLVENYSTSAFTGVTFVGTTFKVELGANNSLSVINTTTGQAISVTPGTSAPTNPVGGSGGGSSGGDVDAPAFNPAFEAPVFDAMTGVLTVSMSQTSGDDQIAALYATVQNGQLRDLSAVDTLSQNTSNVLVEGAEVFVDLKQNDAAPSTATLPTALGASALGDLQWKGFLVNRAGTTQVASFQVFQAGAATHMVTTYAATSPSGVLQSFLEHKPEQETTLSTMAFADLPDNFSVTVVAVSRNGVSRKHTLTGSVVNRLVLFR